MFFNYFIFMADNAITAIKDKNYFSNVQIKFEMNHDNKV